MKFEIYRGQDFNDINVSLDQTRKLCATIMSDENFLIHCLKQIAVLKSWINI
jgi:hypothetical protein